MKKFSFSKLNTYLSCPAYYEWKYVMKNFDAEKNDHFAIGSGVAKFLEEYAKDRTLSISQLQQIYIKAALKNPAADNHKFIHRYKELVPVYVNSGKALKPWTLPNGNKAVEVPFNFKSDKLGIWIHGDMDIITDRHSIVDYKCVGYPLEKAKVDDPLNDYGLQLTLYTVAYYYAYGRLPRNVGLQAILKDFSVPQNVASTRTKRDVDDCVALIKENESKIRREEFPKKPSWKCKNCTNLRCPKRGKRF